MEEEIELQETMERLKVKRQLILDVTELYEIFSKKIAVYKACGFYGKKFLNKSVKEIYKDFKKGVKQINEKIPVFIELPTYRKEGENMYSKKSDLKGNLTKEITVTTPILKTEKNGLVKNGNVDIVPDEEIE